MRDGLDAPAFALAPLLAASRRAQLQVGNSRARGDAPPQIAEAAPAAPTRAPIWWSLTGAQAAAGFIDFVEQARAFAFSQRNQLLKDGLTPSIEGGQLLSSGKQLLIDDTKWAIERSLRILLGKTPIERFG